MWLVRGWAIFREAVYSTWESLRGLFRPIQPKRTGRANRSRSELLGGGLPVRFGIS